MSHDTVQSDPQWEALRWVKCLWPLSLRGALGGRPERTRIPAPPDRYTRVCDSWPDAEGPGASDRLFKQEEPTAYRGAGRRERSGPPTERGDSFDPAGCALECGSGCSEGCAGSLCVVRVACGGADEPRYRPV